MASVVEVVPTHQRELDLERLLHLLRPLNRLDVIPALERPGRRQRERRLDRLERLVLLISRQVGVPPQGIAQLPAATDRRATG
jgi:hypothetical protein